MVLFEQIKKISLILFFLLFSEVSNAQAITKKNDKYGLINIETGDVILQQKYDSIYILPFDKHFKNDPSLICQSPLFACVTNEEIQLFNSFHKTFHPNSYDEIRMTNEFDEDAKPYPAKYNPAFIECILLRKGNYWGYIAHQKDYGFHDELKKTDVFTIIEPQYSYLKFVEEMNGYESRKYVREKRIMVAQKDSLYGALDFETGAEIVPFRHKFPILSIFFEYNVNRIEVLSTETDYTPYYLAGKNYNEIEKTVINAQGYDVSFDIDYEFKISIYREYGKDYLYLFSKELPLQTLTIYDYNIGDFCISHQCDSTYEIFSTQRFENILCIADYSKTLRRYQITWYNFESKKIILFHEDKREFLFNYFFYIEEKDGVQIVYFKKKKKDIGKIVGSGSDLHIEWTKKVYLKNK